MSTAGNFADGYPKPISSATQAGPAIKLAVLVSTVRVALIKQ